MKAILLIAMTLSLFLVNILPAAAAEKALYVNEAFSNKQMKTIEGKEVKFSQTSPPFGEVNLGFVFTAPAQWTEKEDDVRYYPDEYGVTLYHLPRRFAADEEKLNETRDRAEFDALSDKLDSALIPVISVVNVHEDDQASKDAHAQQKQEFAKVELLAEHGQQRIYIGYNDMFDGLKLEKNEEAELKSMVQTGIPHIKTSLMLFPPQDYFDYYGANEEQIDAGFDSAFEARDLKGNAFTQKDFAKYDLTMINVWSTACGPCLEEMPQLAALQKKLPKNVNLISICMDGAEETEFAQKVLDVSGANFQTLIADAGTKDILKNVDATPTTLFVNSKGEVVGSAIIGAPASEEKFVDTYLAIIGQRLDMLKK